MSVDILGTSWDQYRSMVQYSFTSTETRRLVRTDSPGRPLRLSHSSWTMATRLSHRSWTMGARAEKTILLNGVDFICWRPSLDLSGTSQALIAAPRLCGQFGPTLAGSGLGFQNAINQTLSATRPPAQWMNIWATCWDRLQDKSIVTVAENLRGVSAKEGGEERGRGV